MFEASLEVGHEVLVGDAFKDAGRFDGRRPRIGVDGLLQSQGHHVEDQTTGPQGIDGQGRLVGTRSVAGQGYDLRGIQVLEEPVGHAAQVLVTETLEDGC